MESTQNKTRCPHSKKCGGCQLQNLDYKEQLAHKERTCIRLLGKFCRVEPIIGMENPYHYRNKVQAAFGTTRAGRIISGIYQSSTHNIVAVDNCMTEDEIADRIIVDIRRLLRDFKMRATDFSGESTYSLFSAFASTDVDFLCSEETLRSYTATVKKRLAESRDSQTAMGMSNLAAVCARLGLKQQASDALHNLTAGCMLNNLVFSESDWRSCLLYTSPSPRD